MISLHLGPDPVLEVADARSLPLPDGCIGAQVTSPPYSLSVAYPQGDIDPADWTDYMRAMLAEAYRIAEPCGRLCLNVPFDVLKPEPRPLYAEAVQIARAVGWQYRTTIEWAEGNISRSLARGSVDSPSAPCVILRSEAIVVLYKPPTWKRPRPTGVQATLTRQEWLAWTDATWTFPGASARRYGHPAPFPEELPRRCIKLFSWPGDTVLDQHMGSGTAVKVANDVGRRAVGFDIAPEYVELARRRVGVDKRGSSA